MKQKLLIPALAVAGGAAAFALRLMQNSTGFEADTGLAVTGNFAGTALPILLVLLAAAAILLARKLPKTVEKSLSFPAAFPAAEATDLLLPVAGVLLMALSGAADAAMALDILPGALFPANIHLLLALVTLVSAGGLFLGAAACRQGRHQEGEFKAVSLLPVTVMLVVRLVLTYRTVSTDPTLEAYYVELLAVVFLTLGFFRLSGFAFDDARPRRFAVSSVMAVAFSMAAIADRSRLLLSSLALYVGGALVLLGFLVLYTGKDE